MLIRTRISRKIQRKHIFLISFYFRKQIITIVENSYDKNSFCEKKNRNTTNGCCLY